jgi:hypothetical protein
MAPRPTAVRLTHQCHFYLAQPVTFLNGVDIERDDV